MTPHNYRSQNCLDLAKQLPKISVTSMYYYSTIAFEFQHEINILIITSLHLYINCMIYATVWAHTAHVIYIHHRLTSTSSTKCYWWMNFHGNLLIGALTVRAFTIGGGANGETDSLHWRYLRCFRVIINSIGQIYTAYWGLHPPTGCPMMMIRWWWSIPLMDLLENFTKTPMSWLYNGNDMTVLKWNTAEIWRST